MLVPTIGLEVHVQLATQSKAFCADHNAFGAAPNTLVSAVSLAYPGTLPVLNERQVEYAVRLGLALGCRINRRSYFERKNYFYADLPKGYQITQDHSPICIGGALPIYMAPAAAPKKIALHHIHMEEDAGKSLHQDGERFSRVDLNRAGTPLLEIVTEPCMHSAEEVDAFMTQIRRLVRWLGISEGNMEEGNLRCDVNVSMAPAGELGTRCELKNMNSMRFARRAVNYEIERQTALLEAGHEVVQETRQYDPESGTTSGLRDKEDAHDYRYFPEPDLPPVYLAEAYVAGIRSELCELPWEATAKLHTLGLDYDDASLIADDRKAYAIFMRYAEVSPDVPALAKLWLNRIVPAGLPPGLEPEAVAEVQELIRQQKVSAAAAAGQLLPDLLSRPGRPDERARQLNLLQNKDGDYLRSLATEVVATHPDKAATYRRGKRGLIGFFMGEVMKRSRGSAEPKQTRALLEEILHG